MLLTEPTAPMPAPNQMVPSPSFWQRLLGETPPSPSIVQRRPRPTSGAGHLPHRDYYRLVASGLELVSDRFAALLARGNPTH